MSLFIGNFVLKESCWEFESCPLSGIKKRPPPEVIYVLVGASVSKPPSSDANGTFLHIYIYYIYICVSYVVPHILNLSNLTHVTSIKYV